MANQGPTVNTVVTVMKSHTWPYILTWLCLFFADSHNLAGGVEQLSQGYGATEIATVP